MKRPPNVKFLVAITGVALAGGVGASFYQYSAMSEVAARIESLEKKSKDEKSLAAQAIRTSTQLQECSARLVHLEKGVPETAYVPTLLKDLETVGKTCGINVLGVRPVPKVEVKGAKPANAVARKPYEELKIEVKGRGTFRSVMNFVQALKTFPKIVAARTVTLAPKLDPTNKSSANLDLTLELKSFVFPAEKKTEPDVKFKVEVKRSNG